MLDSIFYRNWNEIRNANGFSQGVPLDIIALGNSRVDALNDIYWRLDNVIILQRTNEAPNEAPDSHF